MIEPWRAAAFPVIRDCAVDRTAFDRIIQAGGFVSVNTGAAPEASTIPVPKADADRVFDAAACIGCGACVAASVSWRRLVITSRVGESTSQTGGTNHHVGLCGHHRGDGVAPELSKEPLTFDNVHLATRSYK